MSILSVDWSEGSRWVGEGRNYFFVLFDFVFAVYICYLLGVSLSELSLGARALPGCFEGRFANPWWLDCGALAGFQQLGSWGSRVYWGA